MDKNAIIVTRENFVDAETARMFDAILMRSRGEVNVFHHDTSAASIEKQPVIRLNRDTVYSTAVVDIVDGATLTLPETDGRYMSAAIKNEHHYMNNVFYEAGDYELTTDEFDTEYVVVSIRTFIYPNDPEDIEKVKNIQDGIKIKSNSARKYTHPIYDEESRKKVLQDLLKPENQVSDTIKCFGKKSEVDPEKHLAATASGWGGLPETEAFYLLDTKPRKIERLSLTLKDVPVDAFWSLSIYNKDGFFEKNTYDSYVVNSATAESNEDGSITINLSNEDMGKINFLYIMDGWNYAFRLYLPREEVINGKWTLPEFEPAS